MRDARSSVVAVALLVASLMAPGRAEAQAVAFEPNVGAIPDGVGLGVTPVVTADRRYVRLSLGVNFSTINGFSSFPIPAAVGGGGNGSGLGGLGALGGLGGNRGGGNGGAPGGFRNVMGPGDQGVPYRLEYIEAIRQANAQAKAAQAGAKPVKGKKPLADPVMVPSKKKGEAKAGVPGAPRG